MKSQLATSLVTSGSRKPPAAAQAATIPPAARAHVAANDDAAKGEAARSAFDIFKNDPLWALAISMGIFFGLMAALLAAG